MMYDNGHDLELTDTRQAAPQPVTHRDLDDLRAEVDLAVTIMLQLVDDVRVIRARMEQKSSSEARPRAERPAATAEARDA